MILSLYNYFRFFFRYIQTYSSIIQEHTHAYSELCVSLAYSEPWHIPITKYIQTPSYINNTQEGLNKKEMQLYRCNILYFDIYWILFIRLMSLNRVKLGRAVTFMKCLTSVVSLIFLPKTLIWNKNFIPNKNFGIKFSEFCRASGKWAYEEYLPKFLFLSNLWVLIVKILGAYI